MKKTIETREIGNVKESESESDSVTSGSLRPILEWAAFSFSRGSSQPRD